MGICSCTELLEDGKAAAAAVEAEMVSAEATEGARAAASAQWAAAQRAENSTAAELCGILTRGKGPLRPPGMGVIQLEGLVVRTERSFTRRVEELCKAANGEGRHNAALEEVRAKLAADVAGQQAVIMEQLAGLKAA
eukprot:1190823-Prorocentrum_minimum.AAC.1